MAAFSGCTSQRMRSIDEFSLNITRKRSSMNDIHTTKHTEKPASEPSRQLCSPIMELRQYTLHPGQRDVLIGLFESTFIEAQEAVGAMVIGQFRDLEDPNRFVWLRGFPDMDKRLTALQAFYGGPVWQEHRAEANATLIDSDN